MFKPTNPVKIIRQKCADRAHDKMIKASQEKLAALPAPVSYTRIYA